MLEVRDLHAGYGRMQVVRGVSLAARPGEILLIGGENGAGKSTLLRTIGGFIRPERGEVSLEGTSLVGRKPEQIVGSGLRLVLDGHRVFPDITVEDNIRLGRAHRREMGAEFEDTLAEVHAVFPILRDKAKSYARELSGGQQQMLSLAQAFVAQPKVILCDEPSMGLAQSLMPQILAFLRRWATSGVAVVIVEQQLDQAMGVADRVLVMERGALT